MASKGGRAQHPNPRHSDQGRTASDATENGVRTGGNQPKTIASFGIFQFLWVWNDLLGAKTFGGTSPGMQSVTADADPQWEATERTGTCRRLRGSSRSSSR